VTGRKIVFLVHSGLWWILYYIFLAKLHSALRFVFAGFLKKRFLFRAIKFFPKTKLPFPDFANFMAWVQPTFWCSLTQVFWFVCMRDRNKSFKIKLYICI
jgi:hypothetical protein